MFQIARQKQTTVDIVRTPAVQRDVATPGKRAFTDQLHSAHLGSPDYYTVAVESATREIAAVRSTALPNFIQVLRKKDIAPLQKEIELARVAMQVRHLLMIANKHVYLLEHAATFTNPLVVFLRRSLDVLVSRAVKLGVYKNAEDMIPRRYEEERPKQPGGNKHNQKLSTKTDHKHEQKQSVFAKPAQVTKAAKPAPVPAPKRIARGTAPVAKASKPAAVRAPVQRKADGGAKAGNVLAVAARGVQSASSPLPFASQIQRAFGRHDVSNIRVQIGGEAATASRALGAKAYATGNSIAFAHAPDLHTAAHEAAHIIQQRAGLSLGEIDDGSSDSHEQQADAIADAVVAGRSVEHILDGLRGSGPTQVVQRKPGGDSSYSYTHSGKERSLELGGMFKKIGAEAKYKWQWQVALKNGGKLGGKNNLGHGVENEWRMFSTSAGIERADKQFEAKLQAELFKNATKILDGEPFELGIGLAVQFETKALDAAITTQKFDLKLATLTANVEGDFSKWMNTEHFEVKGSVSLEISFGPEAAKQLLTVAKAARDLEKVMRFQAKYAAAHARVAGMRKVDFSDLAGLSDDKARALFNEIEARKSALRELDQLEGMRGRFKRMADAASKQVRRAGKRLSSSAGGKILRKLGAKVLSKVFTKFIPVVNAISTMQDLYDIGEHLAGIEWGEVMSRIMNGGEGGTVFGTAQPNLAEGAGIDGATIREEELGDAASFEEALDEHEAVALHGKASKVMDLLLGSGGGKLDPSEAYEINGLVPADLTDEEIGRMRELVVSIASAGSNRVDAVQRAIDIVRPRGEKQVTQGPKPAPRASSSAVSVTSGTAEPAPRLDALVDVRVVDVEEELRRAIRVMPNGDVFVPSLIKTSEFRASVVQLGKPARLSWGDENSASGHEYLVRATFTPIDADEGLRLADGRSVFNGHPLEITVQVGLP